MATVESASQLVFLHELHKYKAATKVRFICWYGAPFSHLARLGPPDRSSILEYDTTTGLLLVEHAYPATAPQTPQAHVDINLVIETTKSELFERGAWINVIGYVQALRQRPVRPSSTVPATNKEATVYYPCVQAILVWDAGSLTISNYEASVEQHRAALSDARHVLDQFQS